MRGAKTLVVTLALLTCWACPGLAGEEQPAEVLFVFDASGSMLARSKGKQKLAAARKSMRDLLKPLKAHKVAVGLIAFGHRKGGCDDIELVAPLGKRSHSKIKRFLKRVKPRGRTPLAGALTLAKRTLAGKSRSARTRIVIVTDGLETCGGDPVALARKLRSAHRGLTVHVIALGVKSPRPLKQIAEAGGGSFRAVDDMRALDKAFSGLRYDLGRDLKLDLGGVKVGEGRVEAGDVKIGGGTLKAGGVQIGGGKIEVGGVKIGPGGVKIGGGKIPTGVTPLSGPNKSGQAPPPVTQGSVRLAWKLKRGDTFELTLRSGRKSTLAGSTGASLGTQSRVELVGVLKVSALKGGVAQGRLKLTSLRHAAQGAVGKSALTLDAQALRGKSIGFTLSKRGVFELSSDDLEALQEDLDLEDLLEGLLLKLPEGAMRVGKAWEVELLGHDLPVAVKGVSAGVARLVGGTKLLAASGEAQAGSSATFSASFDTRAGHLTQLELRVRVGSAKGRAAARSELRCDVTLKRR